MRYADGPTVEVEVRVDASPERVWAVASDITVPARFSEELVDSAWTAGATGPALGARFVGHSAHPAIGEWETTCVVAECEPPARFAWDVETEEGISASWRFELVADGEGTVLRQWARMGPAGSGLTPAILAMPDKEERIVAHRMKEWRTNMIATVEGIKVLVEARP